MTWVEVVLIAWLLVLLWLGVEAWRVPLRPDLEPDRSRSRLGLSEDECLAELRYAPGREARRRARRPRR